MNIAELAAALPADLVDALRGHGFAKVASVMGGVDAESEYAVYQKIGASLLYRARERSQIAAGLRSLRAVEDR